jgi:hypothetical protein
MAALLNEMKQHIAQSMGEDVHWVDEDYGQLEALQYGEDQYPVQFPCVLIGTPETEWQSMKTTVQRGKGVLSVRIAFDCYDDTFYGSKQESATEERARIVQRLNTVIHGWRFDNSSPLVRRRSRGLALPKGIKVYETVYELNMDESVVSEKG